MVDINWRGLRRYRFELLLLAPLALYILAFTLTPVLQSIWMSFHNPDELFTLDYWRALFQHGQFSRALGNTLAITAMGLTLELGFGLFLAWCLSRKFMGRGLVRALLLIPMGVPTLVSAVNLMYVFDSSGYLNELLYRLGLITVPVDWAAGGLRTLLMVVTADLWKVTPVVMILLLAGLEAIPLEAYEAAAVDGATPGQTFTRITLPLLKPAITTAVILRGIDTFRIFELPLVMAGRQTPVLATYAFTEFQQYHNPHTSGAAATFLLLLVMTFAVLYIRLAGEEVEM